MKNLTRWSLFLFMPFLLILFLLFTHVSAEALSSLDQPGQGPGGKEYSHQKVIHTSYEKKAQQYHLFEPDSPRPVRAPFLVFLHGHGGINPEIYGDWIEHLVKKGNIVLFPVYQTNTTGYDEHIQNAIQTTLKVIQLLNEGDHVKPDLEKFALVGHSLGGLLAANMAALAQEVGLPRPKAIMSVEPGLTSPLEDLTKIHPETLLLTIVGDGDETVGDEVAKKIFYGTPQINLENKDFIILVSDSNRLSPLIADHYAPCCRYRYMGLFPVFTTDALDYYCFWKLFDGLTEAAFYHQAKEYALGNTKEQRYMGKWLDGTLRRELIVTDSP